MKTTVWCLEQRIGKGLWYRCWDGVFDTKRQAQKALKDFGWCEEGLINEDGSRALFHVARYELRRTA